MWHDPPASTNGVALCVVPIRPIWMGMFYATCGCIAQDAPTRPLSNTGVRGPSVRRHTAPQPPWGAIGLIAPPRPSILADFP